MTGEERVSVYRWKCRGFGCREEALLYGLPTRGMPDGWHPWPGSETHVLCPSCAAVAWRRAAETVWWASK